MICGWTRRCTTVRSAGLGGCGSPGRSALRTAELAHLWPEYGGLRFHDLRHTHATWLIAQRVPMIAVAGRLGHANAVVTMMVYAHVDKLVDRGLLTTDELGLAGRWQLEDG